VNFVIDGHRTSLRPEPVMWDALHDIAAHQQITVDELVSGISNAHDPRDNLSAAIRVYIVGFYRSQVRL
jgi:predicted DNA-binding ribbon-helix-helix protein